MKGREMDTQTYEEFWQQCLEDSDKIYVRVNQDGWKSVTLSSLPPEEQEEWIKKWWEERKQR